MGVSVPLLNIVSGESRGNHRLCYKQGEILVHDVFLLSGVK